MQVSDFTAPSPVIGRLEELEQDLGSRQNELETAARDKARLIRDWEKRLAIARLAAKGSDAESRKAQALITAIESDGGELYEQLTDAESRYEALKAVTRVIETRLSVGQSILRAQSVTR